MKLSRLAPWLFWVLLITGLSFDFAASDKPRAEPAMLAMGSGKAAAGGHCSGR
ncbi:MAG: hypothetical protein ACO21C_03270 [Burkholderiaceae bacterium]